MKAVLKNSIKKIVILVVVLSLIGCQRVPFSQTEDDNEKVNLSEVMPIQNSELIETPSEKATNESALIMLKVKL